MARDRDAGSNKLHGGRLGEMDKRAALDDQMSGNGNAGPNIPVEQRGSLKRRKVQATYEERVFESQMLSALVLKGCVVEWRYAQVVKHILMMILLSFHSLY